jgi:hypothetical protein
MSLNQSCGCNTTQSCTIISSLQHLTRELHQNVEDLLGMGSEAGRGIAHSLLLAAP